MNQKKKIKRETDLAVSAVLVGILLLTSVAVTVPAVAPANVAVQKAAGSKRRAFMLVVGSRALPLIVTVPVDGEANTDDGENEVAEAAGSHVSRTIHDIREKIETSRCTHTCIELNGTNLHKVACRR